MALHRSGSFDGSGHAPRQGRLDGRDANAMFLIRMSVLYMNFSVEME